MVRNLKWELKKWFYRLRWVFLISLVLIVSLFMIAVVPFMGNKSVMMDYVLKTYSILFTLLVLFFCVLIPIINMIVDYISPYRHLEVLTERNINKYLIIKFVLNAMFFMIGMLIGKCVSSIAPNLFKNGMMNFSVTGGNGAYIILFFIFGIIIPTVAHFLCMLSYYFRIEKKHKIFEKVLITLTIFVCLYFISRIKLVQKVDGVISFIVFICMIDSANYIAENIYEPQ